MGICSWNEHEMKWTWNEHEMKYLEARLSSSRFLYHNTQLLVIRGPRYIRLCHPDFEHAVPFTWNSPPHSYLSGKFIFHLSSVFSDVTFSSWIPWHYPIPLSPKKLHLFTSVDYYLYVDSSSLRGRFWKRDMSYLSLFSQHNIFSRHSRFLIKIL